MHVRDDRHMDTLAFADGRWSVARRAAPRTGRVRGDPHAKVLRVRVAWVAGCDGETGQSGFGLLPQFSGPDLGSLYGRKEMTLNQLVIVV